MNNIISRGISIVVLTMFLVFNSTPKSQAQDVTVSFQEFYDNLSPYGQWVNDPEYGNVWVPNEGGDFRPYGSRGHWVMTDYGNTWVTDDPWGWACYHYGRWTYDPYYGWVWIPGYEWAPAWVTWRYGRGYCGWAPLAPGVSVGAGFNCPESWWVFVQPQYMFRNDCYSHWRGPSYNNTYIRQTTVVNNYYVDNGTHVRYNYGPRPDAIQRDIHQPVQVYHMEHKNRPGPPSIEGNRVSIYRPAVNRATVNTARPGNVIQAPRQISRQPKPATVVSPNRQPEFRQQMLHQQPQRQGAPQQGRQEPMHQQPGQQPQRQAAPPQGRPEPMRQQPQQGRPEPMRQQPQQGRPEPMRQQPQQNRPAPMRQQPPQNRPEPMRQQPPQNRPEPMRQQPPQNRPEPMRQQPPQNRPEPMRQQPPQNRPEPMRQQPPQNRPEPMRQQPPQNRPEPMRQQPPQNRPEPMRQQPPQNRPEPMRQQPAPQPQRQQPAPQPQRQAPPPQNRPQPQPQHQGPPPERQEPQHEGGRR
jgi:hypothetical protein